MSDVEVTTVEGKGPARLDSDFLCRELLYEHLTENLEDLRKEDIEIYINKSEASEQEYKKLLLAQEYCTGLSQAKIQPDLLEKIKFQKKMSEKVLGSFHWKNWPVILKWVLQALSLATVTAFIMILVPWKELPVFKEEGNATIELARVDQAERVKPEAGEESAAKTELTKAVSDVTQLVGQEPEPKKIEKPKVVEEKKPEVVAAKPVEKKEVKPVAKPLSATKLKGFVYRAYLYLNDLDAMTPVIADKIRSMGGKKAGKVQLGWRQKGGSYFNFSLSENKYEDVVEYLKGLGAFSVNKDAHRRVMPDGQVRIILWIEGAEK